MKSDSRHSSNQLPLFSGPTARMQRTAQRRMWLGQFREFANGVCDHMRRLAGCSFQIWDVAGRGITKRHKPHSICEWLHDGRRVGPRCSEMDDSAVLEVLDECKNVDYICWAGFTCFMEPIVIKSVPVGAISVGEFLTKELPQVTQDCWTECERVGISRQKLSAELTSGKVATLEMSDLASLKNTTRFLARMIADMLLERLSESNCVEYFDLVEEEAMKRLSLDKYGFLLTSKIIRTLFGSFLTQKNRLADHERQLGLHHVLSPLHEIKLLLGELSEDANKRRGWQLVDECDLNIRQGLAPEQTPQSIWMRPTEKESVDLSRLVSEIVYNERSKLDSTDKIDIDIPKNLQLSISPSHLKWILWNILHNAIKASDPPRAIRIHAEQSDHELILIVEDNGCGMSEDELNLLFERATPGNSFRERGREGKGMGLYLVKELVERNWGELSIDSEQGKGTIVQVAFTHMEVIL